MRLSTTQIFQQGISAILDQQSRLSQAQQQVSTGKRINSPSDDPVGSARVIDIGEQIAIAEQYERNAGLAVNQLGLEENALVGVENILQRVRELTVQANNDTLSPENRKSIAVEIRTRLDELVALANSKDANGDYLFAGFQKASQPFSLNNGVVSYNGDQGQTFLQVGPQVQVPVNDSGAEVFQLIDTGNGVFTVTDDPGNTGTGIVGATSEEGVFIEDTYTLTFTQLLPDDPITYQVTGAVSGPVATGTYNPGDSISFNGAVLALDGEPADGDSFVIAPAGRQDLFSTLDRLATALESDNGSPLGRAQLHNEVNRQLNNLDQALEKIVSVRARVGTRLNNIESQSQLNQGFILQMQQARSDIEDVDLIEAVSQLNFQAISLQAAQQAYVQVQGLSLFNLL